MILAILADSSRHCRNYMANSIRHFGLTLNIFFSFIKVFFIKNNILKDDNFTYLEVVVLKCL